MSRITNYLLAPLLLIISSCGANKQISESDDPELILELLEKLIVNDSLYETRTMNKYLLAYEYYEQEFSDEGHLIPPPYGIGWKNELDIINSIKLTQSFSDSISIAHVKDQLIKSKKNAKRYKLNNQDLAKLGMINEDQTSWYSFYLPIFNSDSSAVYLQSEFYTNNGTGYGEGNGTVFIKENGEWEFLESIPGWIK